jgi:hypothetical protein
MLKTTIGDITKMATTTTKPGYGAVPLKSPAEEEAEWNGYLDETLLILETYGSDGLLAADGTELFQPRVMAALDTLVARGLAQSHIVQNVSVARGRWRSATYLLTDAGLLRCAVLREQDRERELSGAA